jgi:ATP-dependent helicase YprA (DUF1998 family)
MKQAYFSGLLPELATRAARACVSRLGFSNKPLRLFLSDYFSAGFGEPGCFLGDPVFEATFGWQAAEQDLQALAKSGLLTHALVDALDKPGKGKSKEYAFPKKTKPYSHQLAAWQRLSEEKPASIVVTSGTGSGKTECFMVPILDQLVRRQQKIHAPLVGVEALFLYPLNALIQSQRERLNAWTTAFDGNIRYCLYNGNTPEKKPQHERNLVPNEVMDREILRATPPPILVTNITMLEYMLVRAVDAPILDKSKGKLKWIVLDEAHTYIGSQAAELALLLRRVLHAFEVKPEEVRFVATSATIGSGKEIKAQLQRFLAEVSGQKLEQVHVISGTRQVPDLPAGDAQYAKATLETLVELPENKRRLALCGNATARKIRDAFVQSTALQLSGIRKTLGANQLSQLEALRWLDLLTSIPRTNDQESFLPLRAHLFHNVLEGLWACADPECIAKQKTSLDDTEWKFGMVYTEPRKHCACGAPVYELRSCNDCNTTYLWAQRKISDNSPPRLLQTQNDGTDEFALEEEITEGEDSSENPPEKTLISSDAILIANAHPNQTTETRIDCETLILAPFTEEPKKSIALGLRSETGQDNGDVRLSCPECGASHEHENNAFRPARLGAPFLLNQIIPTLFEFCPDIDSAEDKPLARPLRGRRMISFTDSRQGTARLAVNLQQTSERNRVRGLIYQHVLAAGHSAASAEATKLKEKLAKNKAILEHLPANIPISARDDIAKGLGIEQDEQALAALADPKAVAFQEISTWLATNTIVIQKWMHAYYEMLDSQVFGASNGKTELARMLMAREFATRAKRSNTLETMGLIRTVYPKLDNIKNAPDFQRIHVPIFSLSDWKDFLKICLDFHVRGGWFLDINPDWRKTFGLKFSIKKLLPQDKLKDQTKGLRAWPSCAQKGRQNRLVRLLAHVCNLDASSPTGKDAINTILRAAWDALVKIDLLKRGAEGRYLALEDIAFAPIQKAWMCPVTRRVLDVTFRGVTPYLPPKGLSPKVTECVPITVPVCDLVLQDFANDESRQQNIRDWTSKNVEIQALRDEGLWSDLNDRILEGGAYFRAAEHSAQLPGHRLQEYESLFKRGYINLLSCSTTMEMGVDIGGISVVAMNNVPPHPANYLQRAGRAGRRAETRSIALSLCKNNPHDQNVFRDTLWAFKTLLPAPSVTLNSYDIIQRHINAMLLNAFMKKHCTDASAEKLNMEWWLLPKDKARFQQFCTWTKYLDLQQETVLANGLRSLLAHSRFANTSLVPFCKKASGMARQHAEHWYPEYDIMTEELAHFAKSAQKDPAFRALQFQQKRLTQEYLLRELASNGFLPGYGFPTNIISFENLTCDALRQLKSEREDNRYQRRELPSRDAATALCEYAPKAEVVLDGLVYKSAGITLNWHRPASIEGVNEVQNLRQAWRCSACGSSGTALRTEYLNTCPDCGAPIDHADDSNHFNFLEPAGFAVDLYAHPHNDVSTPTYIHPMPPWVNAHGDWLPLVNPTLGWYRSATDGTVFHRSRDSYDICLACGRAASTEDGIFYDQKGLPKPHKRLRGRQEGEEQICQGSAFAVQKSLRLGFEAQTDVLELFLCAENGAPIADKTTAYSLAVAIRNATAQMLGIELAELNCDVKPIRPHRGMKGYAITIFDNHASGYSSSVIRRLPEILHQARKQLDCKANCDNACQACLLDFDTRFHTDDLNRHEALKFLTPQWLAQLKLPPEYEYFSVGQSVAEHQPLFEAITQELSFSGHNNTVRIFCASDPEDWDMPASPLRQYVQKWAASEYQVQMVIPANAIDHITEEDARILDALSRLADVTLHTGDPPATQHGAIVLACVGQTAWATNTAAVALPAAQWGCSEGAMIVRGEVDALIALSDPITLEFTTSKTSGTHLLRIQNELDGPISDFGDRLLNAIEKQLGKPLFAKQDEVIKVSYSDRYLNSPLPVTLFLNFIHEVREQYKDNWRECALDLTTDATCPPPSPFSPQKIWTNWQEAKERNQTIRKACEYGGWTLHMNTLNKRQIPHSRLLEFHLQNGASLKMWLDQGFGYWNAAQSNAFFPFGQNDECQAKQISATRAKIEGQGFETHIFVVLP